MALLKPTAMAAALAHLHVSGIDPQIGPIGRTILLLQFKETEIDRAAIDATAAACDILCSRRFEEKPCGTAMPHYAPMTLRLPYLVL